MQKPPPKTGLARLIRAFGFSVCGLTACYRNEAAFRQELLLFVLLLPVIYLLPVSVEFKLLILLVNSLVLILEVVNSALEAIVDKASPEFHELAKHAKDMGSAAVLLTLILAGVVWCSALFAVFV
jgi:diacylglycerol kinase (ATP)